MTDAAAPTYRPSPRPRPVAAPGRDGDAPTLRLITDRDPETCIADLQAPPAERETPPGRLTGLKSAITVSSDWVSARVAASTAYWTPPAVFTDKPASLAELAEYARHAPWTDQAYIAQPYTDETTKKQVKTGPIRAAGIWYYRGLAYPYTVISRYREWFVQRPMRLVALVGAVKLAAATDPGIWAVHHLIYPAATLAGRIFL